MPVQQGGVSLLPTSMISDLLLRISPRLLWRYRVGAWMIDAGEPEMDLLPRLAHRPSLSLDIGAANGAYSAALVSLSSAVVAFEPVPAAAHHLREMFRGTRLVRVEEVALSDRRGEARLRVPADRWTRSTIEPENLLRTTESWNEVSVQRVLLDDYDFKAVGFIKIDVEGHEHAVLEGASETITRERPNVMIEVEEQHKPGSLSSVFDFFERRSYSGFFYLNKQLHSIREFNPQLHQDTRNLDDRGNRRGMYINNFVFTQKLRLS